MIAPHTSARYAVIHAHALDPAATGYTVVAVHALWGGDGVRGMALVSAAVTSGTLLAFHPPLWVPWTAIAVLCANNKAAHAIRADMLDQDRRAEKRPVCSRCGNRPAEYAVRPGDSACKQCMTDDDWSQFR